MANASESIPQEWFRRVWNELDSTAIDELFGEESVAHGLGKDSIRGPRQFREFHRAFTAVFRAIRTTILQELQSDDRIVIWAKVSLIPPGHSEPVEFEGCSISIVRGRQIVESWNSWNFLGLLEEMRVLPTESLQLALGGRLKVYALPAAETPAKEKQGASRHHQPG